MREHLPWNKGLKGYHAGINNPMYGKHHSEEAKKKMSIVRIGKKLSEETKKKLSLSHRGKKFSEEHKRKIGLANSISLKGHISWNKGKKFSEEHKRKISEALKGKKASEETRKKLSKINKGKKLSKETKQKMSECRKGKKSHFWKCGISFEPYSMDWTKTLKKAIRERDGYMCGICNHYPAIDVHHIDYDKKNCNPDNLITLCHGCHTKTNSNREYWMKYFRYRFRTNKLSIS